MLKRTWAQIWFAVIMALAVTAGCGGGGGGGGGVVSGGGLPIGSFTTQLATVSSASNSFPFSGSYDTKTQYLYTAAEIGGSGKITKIRLQQTDATPLIVNCPNTTVKMGHTTVSSLTTTWADNVANSAGAEQTVLNNATVTIPVASALRWIEITLVTPFYYNGVDNLVVDIERATACTDVGGHPADVATTVYYVTDRRAYDYWPDDNPGIAEYDVINAYDVDEMLPWMQFVFAGGDNTQDYGGITGFPFPFSTSTPTGFAPLRTQNLYLASDINGSGPITGIAFQNYPFPTLGGTFTFTMTLSHATVTMLSDTFANNYAGTKTTVASAVTFTVPAGVPGSDWFWVPISSGTFSYNGTDNLIVEVVTEAGTGEDVYLMGASSPGQRMWALGATTTTGVVDDIALHVKLRFNGGPVNVITDGAAATSNAFNTAGAGMLNLYRATELGTGGTINSIACRLYNDATATSYSNYKVIIGHSNVDTLVGTAADNFVSQSTAMSGTVTVPAGLLAGDWLEIPLSTPFVYDGVSNLAIWMGTTAASGASGNQACRMSTTDSTLYPGNMASGAPGATTVTPQDNKFDMKLKITK